MTRAEQEAQILARLAEGLSLTSVCLTPELPGRTTVMRWMEEDEGFAEAVARARETGLERMAEEIIEIADAAAPGEAPTAKLRVEARKWILSKQFARKYGDRTILAGDADNPLVALTQEQRATKIQAILAVAQERLTHGADTRATDCGADAE